MNSSARIRQGGFLTLEVYIAMFILSFLALGAMWYQVGSVKQMTQAELEIAATRFAEVVMNDLMTCKSADPEITFAPDYMTEGATNNWTPSGTIREDYFNGAPVRVITAQTTRSGPDPANDFVELTVRVIRSDNNRELCKLVTLI